MISVTREKDGLRVEVRGEAIVVIEELANAVYAAGCGICGSADRRMDRKAAALYVLSMVEAIDLVYSEQNGTKKGALLNACESAILSRMANRKVRERGLFS